MRVLRKQRGRDYGPKVGWKVLYRAETVLKGYRPGMMSEWRLPVVEMRPIFTPCDPVRWELSAEMSGR